MADVTTEPTTNAIEKSKNIKSTLVIEVDLEQMTIGDIAMLDEFRDAQRAKKDGKQSNVPVGRMIAFLDRVVVGGVKHIPAKQLSDVIEQVSAAFSTMMTDVEGSDDPEKN